MALLQAWNPRRGSGPTPPLSIAWERDRVEETNPFGPGYTIILTENPVDENAIIVWSQGLMLDTDDYQFVAPNEIEILFSADPATDTGNGVWVFSIQYPYAT
jgi:hypothetical protein